MTRLHSIVVISLLVLVMATTCSCEFMPLGRLVLQKKNTAMSVLLQADLSAVEEQKRDSVMNDVLGIVRKRLTVLGYGDATTEAQSDYRLLIGMAHPIAKGRADDLSEALAMAGSSKLEFRERIDLKNEKGQVTAHYWSAVRAQVYGTEKVLTSEYFEYVCVAPSEWGGLSLIFEWNDEGKILSEAITTRLIGRPMAIFEGDRPLLGEDLEPLAPIVQAVIKDKGEITGLSETEVNRLAVQIGSGKLPVPLSVVSVR